MSSAATRTAPGTATRLRAGTVVRSARTGRAYTVGPLLGEGGFGAAYAVTASGTDLADVALCLKVAVDPEAWHREAYFGTLLVGEPCAIQVLESFAWFPGGRDSAPLYCLVTERAEQGDLRAFFRRNPEPWPEGRARREITRLLRAVVRLHGAGAVHRDITPANVFVTGSGCLKLGDFGIARHRSGKGPVRADAFAPAFAPTTVRKGAQPHWKTADDVYQLGHVLAQLLLGTVERRATVQDVRRMDCSSELKAVIQRCIGSRAKRFADAEQMLAGLATTQERWARVRSLQGHTVVFTGKLSGLSRSLASALAARAGAVVESRVTRKTSLVVVGASPQWKAGDKGQKLLDVQREGELGHDVARIDETRFLRLVGKRRTDRD